MQTLKRAFQLKNGDKLDRLSKLNTRIKVASLMLSAAREDIEKTMHLRDRLIGEVLLDEHDYIIKCNDRVVYMDQIDKIYVYEDVKTEINGTKIITD